jgi:uncharacterized membrane protein YhhN
MLLWLAAFLMAHLCFLAALIPLVSRSAALLARLPTPWTALGAVYFAVSDAMIGIGKFVLAPTNTEALAVPIWWAYAMSLLLITAGFFFGRASVPSATAS